MQSVIYIISLALIAVCTEAYSMTRFGNLARKVTASAIVASGFAQQGHRNYQKVAG